MITKYLKNKPKISENAFVADGVQLIGAVELGEYSSIWYNTVVRADINTIKIGTHTNIQDGVIIHVSDEIGVIIGDYVTVGHGAQIHACALGNKSLIGTGAIILNGVTVGEEAQVAAGAVVTPNTIIPPRALVIGIPAKVTRILSSQEIEDNVHWARKYVKIIKEYKKRR